MGGEYGSGLPTEGGGTPQDAATQFGEEIANRVDFSRGRVKPFLSIDASAGVDLGKHEHVNMRLQADVENLNNRLNVIDFAGLFSGTAVAPPRRFAIRFETSF